MSIPATATANEAAIVRALSHASFFEFVKEFWHVVIAEEPKWNWHIKYLCDIFQEDAERVFAGEPKLWDTIINISPGSTKSTIFSIMAPAWVIARRADMRILAASHTQALTFELGRKCRMVMDSDLYKQAFPEVVPAPDQWTKSLFMTTAGGGRFAATVGGMSPTGFHAHFIFVDDPLDPQQAKKVSGVEIEAANNFMSEVLPTRKVDKAVCPTFLIMQRLHQNDPTGYLLGKAKEKTRHICLPAERSQKVKPVSLRKFYVAGLMDPDRLSSTILEEAVVDLGEFGYSGQYRQDPVPRGGGMFKTHLLEVSNPPGMGSKQWVAICRFWDKAGTKDGGAYTVGLKMGRWRPTGAPKDGSEDEWWILDVKREQLDSAEREKLLVNTAKSDGKRVVIGIEQEPGSGGKESAQLTVKRLAGYRVRVVPATGTKEERADEWSCMVNTPGTFKMKKAEWNDTLTDELKYFPFSTYKDQADAGAGAFTILAAPSPTIGGRR